MELDCYKIHDIAPEIVPGKGQRAWMDKFPYRHPYRCLPLTMANSTGWEILSPMNVTMEWDGGEMEDAIKFFTKDDPRRIPSFVGSHFRRGVVTFHTGYLFKTPPGWGVWASGSPNYPKHGFSPLTGLIETDWLPFPFTMNWQFTKPGKITFEKDEPFCFITLMEHGKLEDVQPKIKQLNDNPELKQDYEAWRDSRATFNDKLKKLDPKATKQGWQRHYMKGETVTGDTNEDHRTKRRLKKPIE